MADFVKNEDFANQATGAKKPRSFILDASVLEYAQEYAIVKEDIKQNRILFEFPDGVNKLDLMEECRALSHTDDFDLMYDITMQMLVGKPLKISIRDQRGVPVEQALFQVTDTHQNLRGIEFIDSYPVVILWLTEFIGEMLSKKYPMPGNDTESAPSQTSEKRSGAKKTKTMLQH